MRIPLDYYRILGLPIQATAEQLQQAHRDRTRQLPRREYSEIAIETRKQLIDEAYDALSDVDQRKAYDAKFLTKSYPLETAADPNVPQPDPAPSPAPTVEVSFEAGEEALRSLASEPASDAYTPTIDINHLQLTGALLILLELGEYELVIRLGRPYLSSGSSSLADGQFGDPKVVLSDIVLTLCLACLELGREQWQQRQYESAAESLETGRELLMREGLFPAIRGEIQADLYKLRPYRILELVALPMEQRSERRQGVQLLKAMLQDRAGIDGAEDDLSGLNADDFLRFIQQLRSYLTSVEQQELFEAEARRPSAVATYLAVYALLARGFARHQPALVRRAKQLLMQLGGRQDIHLEQAVCALLLGQTEEASRALELSQEYEPLAFIREHSHRAPDLLPGLCLYAERWLQQEVFPHFRDLAQYQSTLKDYFADEQVQAYLEAMPDDSDSDRRWTSSSSGAVDHKHLGSVAAPTHRREFNRSSPPAANVNKAAAPAAAPLDQAAAAQASHGALPLTTAERIAQLSPEGRLQPSSADYESNGAVTPPRQTLETDEDLWRTSPPDSSTAPPTHRSRSTSPHWGRLAMVTAIGLLGVGVLGFTTLRVITSVSSVFAWLSQPKIKGDPVVIRLDQPVIEIPDIQTINPEKGIEDIATETITSWLAAKRAALGQTHNLDALESVLAPPLLQQRRSRAENAMRENWYCEYRHGIELLSVEPDQANQLELAAKAQVSEAADCFEAGRLSPIHSYNDTFRWLYRLVRQDGDNWRIKDIQQIND
ncbi:MAG: IMS domain-containing protein [Leptolyngbyaceae cyanobacterium MO_188.B28]|nr:IMS domain-containing protein [Leptolyngbyaceae cyanobacterium MO_188.B28]